MVSIPATEKKPPVSFFVEFNFRKYLVILPGRTETLFLFGVVNNLCPSTANFALPEEDKEAAVATFVEITFVELDREEAVKIVEQYNKVAFLNTIPLLHYPCCPGCKRERFREEARGAKEQEVPWQRWISTQGQLQGSQRSSWLCPVSVSLLTIPRL